MKDNDEHRLVIRVPTQIYDEFANIAKLGRQSMNAAIVSFMQREIYSHESAMTRLAQLTREELRAEVALAVAIAGPPTNEALDRNVAELRERVREIAKRDDWIWHDGLAIYVSIPSAEPSPQPRPS